MSLTFPTNPTNGQIYPDPALAGFPQFQWNSTTKTWVKLDEAQKAIIIFGTLGGSAPTLRQNGTQLQAGDLWWNNQSISGYVPGLYVYADTPSSPTLSWKKFDGS